MSTRGWLSNESEVIVQIHPREYVELNLTKPGGIRTTKIWQYLAGLLREKVIRIWLLHPKYLDRLGLLAYRFVTLLAQKDIPRETKRCTANHPQ